MSTLDSNSMSSLDTNNSNNSNESLNDSSKETQHETKRGVRNFFRSLIKKNRHKSGKNKNYETNRKNSSTSEKIIKEYVVIEKTDLSHRFLTVKNKDPNLFKDYKENEMIKNAEELRQLIIDLKKMFEIK